jgi:hypothetical protein
MSTLALLEARYSHGSGGERYRVGPGRIDAAARWDGAAE